MKLVRRAAWTIVALAVVFYAGDYFRARSLGAAAFDQITVERMYAVPLKDGKTEYMPTDPAPQTCVRSALPHFGYPPCWYLAKHRQQNIAM